MHYKMAVELMDDGHPNKAMYLSNLAISQKTHFKHLNDPADLVACVLSYKTAAYPAHAFFATKQWAEISYLSADILSALDGYRSALNHFSKVAWLGLDMGSHQDTILKENIENVGCLAATYAIQLGCFEEAVELLDIGWSIFWQQSASL